MLELQSNAHCVAFQKDPEKGYNWNDPSQHLHAYSRHEVVSETFVQSNLICKLTHKHLAPL